MVIELHIQIKTYGYKADFDSMVYESKENRACPMGYFDQSFWFI